MRSSMLLPIMMAVGGCALALTSHPPALGAPFTDTVVKKVEPFDVPRPTPRSLSSGIAQSELFPEGEEVRTLALDLGSLLAEDDRAGSEPLRIGVVQGIRASSLESGRWTALPDGGSLWTASFRAIGARGVQLRIEPWNPPIGSELIVFAANNPRYAAGPFTRTYPARLDAFWTPAIYTERVNLEYYIPPGIDHAARESELVVTGVLNLYRPVAESPSLLELGCHLDVSCYSGWQPDADGVGRLTWTEGGAGWVCSGGMLNRNPTDFTPLFLTAHHCMAAIDPNTNAWVAWFYQSTACNGSVPDLSTLPQTMVIATIGEDPTARPDGLPGTDTRLVGLQSSLPGGVSFLGWDATTWPDQSEAIGIHHPGGTYKRISFGTKVDDQFCGGRTTHEIQYNSAGGYGSLEGGSSGSPLFDASHRVRGVASCVNSNCAGTTYVGYGQFGTAFTRALEAYLVPVDPVYVTGSYGGFERGTSAQPFNRVIKGAYAVQRGHNVFVSAGSYNERYTFDKAMTLNAVGGTVVIGQ